MWLIALLSLLLSPSGGGPVFETVDVVIDAGPQRLAAYQVDLRDTSGGAKIVGIEGGEHAAFAQPPYYDPEAMQRERVILAAFSTNAPQDLPTGKVRVATIHIEREANAQPHYEVELMTAGNADGNAIDAKVQLR